MLLLIQNKICCILNPKLTCLHARVRERDTCRVVLCLIARKSRYDGIDVVILQINVVAVDPSLLLFHHPLLLPETHFFASNSELEKYAVRKLLPIYP
jgi:hypothetical protein